MGEKRIRDMTQTMCRALVALLTGEATLITSATTMDFYRTPAGATIGLRTKRSLENRGFVVTRDSDRYLKLTLLGRAEARSIVEEEQDRSEDIRFATP